MFKYKFTQLFGERKSYIVTGNSVDEAYLNARKKIGNNVKTQHLHDKRMYHVEKI